MQSSTREILKIAVPVSLEMVVMLVLNFVNQIIVGGLGPLAIAAVGFSNSLTFIVAVTIGALGSSVGIMASRAFGAQRTHELNVTVTIALVMGGSVSGALVLFPSLFPQTTLTLAGASQTVAQTGAAYLQLVALSVVPAVLSGVLSSVLRATDHPRSPMIATFVTVILNTLLGYALVYGYGPFPELGIVGAGAATLFTASLKTVILWYQAFALHRTNHINFPREKAEWLRVIKPLFVLAIPMGLTELVWTVGLYLYNVILQRLGDLALASGQIATTLEGIFIVASMGLMSAAQMLVGRSIGAQDPTGAERWIKLTQQMAFRSSLIFAACYIAMSWALPVLFQNAGEDVRHGAVMYILLNAMFQPVRVRNMVLGGGVLPSAYDVRGIIYGDSIGALVVGVPLAAFFTFFTPIGLLGICLARGIDELAKLAVYSYRAKRINWHHVAQDHANERQD